MPGLSLYERHMGWAALQHAACGARVLGVCIDKRLEFMSSSVVIRDLGSRGDYEGFYGVDRVDVLGGRGFLIRFYGI